MPKQVHAHFRLDQVNRSRGYYCPEPGAETQIVEAAYVILGAVKGEPFGAASPNGCWHEADCQSTGSASLLRRENRARVRCPDLAG